MSSTTGYIAEIGAEAASGEIAQIYAEIRRLTGVPLVTLVYRHLATYPGALQALWQSISPLLASGELQEGAWKIARDAYSGPLPPPSADLRALGSLQREQAGNVIDAYNRANAANYAVVCAVRATPSGRQASDAAAITVRSWAPPASIAAIAPVPRMDALDAHTRARVDSFAKSAGPGEPVLVPTLYRNIAYWPALLELAVQEVPPRLACGAFDPAIQSFRRDVDRVASELVLRRHVSIDPRLTTPPLRAVLERFSQLIPEMVVVGHFLRGVLDQI